MLVLLLVVVVFVVVLFVCLFVFGGGGCCFFLLLLLFCTWFVVFLYLFLLAGRSKQVHDTTNILDGFTFLGFGVILTNLQILNPLNWDDEHIIDPHS